MRRVIVSLFVIMAIWSGFSFVPIKETLALGAEAPMTKHKMTNVDGEMTSLNELKQENGLLVVFSCNTCPFVLAWEEEYPKLAKIAHENKVGMVLVNSNAKKREGDDSLEEMKKHHQAAKYNMPYVVDKGAKLADAFGAKTTPHVYLFDGDMTLKYKGAINDKYESSEKVAKKHFLRNAITNMVAGKKIDPASTKELGCSIKRV